MPPGAHSQQPRDWLVGGGELGALIRSIDWSSTPLGPRDRWPQSLRTVLYLTLENVTPIALLWGPELLLLYNDAYRLIAADKHPLALGCSTREIRSEVWYINEPLIAAAMERGEASHFEDKLFPVNRRGYTEEAYFSLFYNPVRVEDGTIGGALVALSETTAAVESRRRLRESEERYRGIVETADEGIWTIDGDALTTFANVRMAEMLGYAAQEMVGRPAFDFMDEAWYPAAQEKLSNLRAGMRERHELALRRKDGTTLWSEVASSPIVDAAGSYAGAMALVTDISQRKQQEEELRRSGALLEAAISQSPSGIIIADAPDVTIRVANSAALGLLGADPTTLVGIPAQELMPKWQTFHPDGTPWPSDQFPLSRAIQQGEVVRGEELIIRDHLGQDRSVSANAAPIRDNDGRIVAGVVVLHDITERKRAESSLLATQELLANAERLAHTGAWEVDLLSNQVAVSEEWRALVGSSSRTFTLGEMMLIAHPDDRARVEESFRGALLGKPYSIESRIIRQDTREVRVVKAYGSVVADASGRPVKLRGAAQDVTDARRAEQALLEADRRKNEFLAMLSHELRNPLAPIRNSLYILGRAAPGGEQANRAMVIINRQVEQMTRLIDELMDVTRISRGKIQLKRERLDLGDLVLRTVEDHRGVFAANGIELTVSAAPSQVWVDGDRARLAQAIGNILQNARKFTPRGGRATVSVEADALGSQAVLTVRDSGVGIAPETMPRMFEAFTQADRTLDRSKGGLGLGLALVKGLVEMHGGSVSAASEGIGQGAVFTLRIPLEPARAETAVAPSEALGPCSIRRVLVVEDNKDAADSLREALELSGHIVVVAYDGPSGIERARALRPEVVFCDIGLPGMDGYAVARALRADPELGHVTLVALTGYAGPEDLAKAESVGFDAHLAKPPSMEAIQRVLEAPSTAQDQPP